MRGIIALVIIVAVAVGIFALAPRKNQPSPDTPKPADAGTEKGTAPATNQGVVIEGPAKIVIECESPAELEDKAPNGEVIFAKASESQGVKVGYLNIPDSWIHRCGLEEAKSEPGKLPGKAIYNFDVPRDDAYYIFLRGRWKDSCGNSLYLRIDDGPWQTMEDTEGKIVGQDAYQWAWHTLRRKGEPLPLKLKAGPARLTLAVKEDGPSLDKFLITTDGTAPAATVVDP